MNSSIVDFLFGSVTALVGAGAAWILLRRHNHEAAQQMAMNKTRHAAEVLARLQDLAARMAIDVGEHSSQVKEINEQLTASAEGEPGEIVTVVAHLIEANEQMREKLATTESRLREQAQQIEIHAAEARTDALTLLANRRAFDDELTRRVAELRRLGNPFSLVMADVDHFKKFNDLHGHLAGDEVLRSIAKVLRQKAREMDMVARIGGEEFAVIMPGTELAEASKAALRLRESIEQARFRYHGQDLRVTASFGLAEASVDESEAALIARADQALYASKQNGRNCVHAHDGEATHRVESVVAEPVPLPQPQAAAEPPLPAPSPPVPDVPQPVQAEDSSLEPESSGGADGIRYQLLSRTTFCQQVRNRIAEWKRGGAAFSVLLAAINCAYQTDARLPENPQDAGMVALIKHLAATLREMDTLAYYAPGCLAVLLPSATLQDATRIGERVWATFPASPHPHAGQHCFSLSLAVAHVTKQDDTISLLRRVESALQAARRRGGNRAFYHDGHWCLPIVDGSCAAVHHA